MNRLESSESNNPYLPFLLHWNSSSNEVLLQRSRLSFEGKPTGIWTGFSTFQSPVTLRGQVKSGQRMWPGTRFFYPIFS